MSEETREERYVKEHAEICPVCRTKDMMEDQQPFRYDSTTITVHIHCKACPAHWYEVFTLSECKDIEK